MKHVLLFLFLLIGTLQTNEVEYVYICTGTYAYTYHKTDKCEGLDRCSREIKKVTKDEAVDKYKRKPCKYCYGN